MDGRARVKAWYNTNVERRQEYQADWRELNREYVNAYWRAYRAAHKPVKMCQAAGCNSPVGWHKRTFCDTHSREYNEEKRKRGYYDDLDARRAGVVSLPGRVLVRANERKDTVWRRTGVAA